MATPYERVIQKAAPPSVRPSQPPRSAATSSDRVLSKVVRKKPIPRPQIRFNLRPRFRFDFPEPPMDPKMLLGRLSTESYAQPYIADIEREFKPGAVPSDPNYGLRVNLVESSMYKPLKNISIDDDALLESVMAGRPGDPRRGSSTLGSAPAPRQSSTPAAPWMRRMSYDEYFSRSAVPTRASLTSPNANTSSKKAKPQLSKAELNNRLRREHLQTFAEARRLPEFPEYKRPQPRPVKVASVLPDLFSLGENFIAFEFDQDELLTFERRQKKDPKGADESIRSLATVSVAEREPTTQKKYIACYTPSDRTLTKRRRSAQEPEEEEDKDSKKPKKISFQEEETYEWIGEYSIREGQIGEKKQKGKPSRSCFALTEVSSANGKKHVASLQRIGKSWKLSKRPGMLQPLGKEGLRILRDESPREIDNEMKKTILTGETQAEAEKTNGKRHTSKN